MTTLLAERLEQRRTDAYVDPNRLTLPGYLSHEWLPLARLSRAYLRHSTYDSYRRNAELHQLPHLLAQRCDRVLRDAGDGSNRLGVMNPFPHEQRSDQVVRGEDRLGHHPAQSRSATEPAEAALREHTVQPTVATNSDRSATVITSRVVTIR